MALELRLRRARAGLGAALGAAAGKAAGVQDLASQMQPAELANKVLELPSFGELVLSRAASTADELWTLRIVSPRFKEVVESDGCGSFWAGTHFRCGPGTGARPGLAAALRLAAVMAITNGYEAPFPTIARDGVFDSRVDPIEGGKIGDMAPIALVFTDDDDGESLSGNNGGPPFRHIVKLIFELSIGMVGQLIDGQGAPLKDEQDKPILGLLPIATEPELELMLDLSKLTGHGRPGAVARPLILSTVATTGEGVADLADAVDAHLEALKAAGMLATRRNERRLAEVRSRLDHLLLEASAVALEDESDPDAGPGGASGHVGAEEFDAAGEPPGVTARRLAERLLRNFEG